MYCHKTELFAALFELMVTTIPLYTSLLRPRNPATTACRGGPCGRLGAMDCSQRVGLEREVDLNLGREHVSQ